MIHLKSPFGFTISLALLASFLHTSLADDTAQIARGKTAYAVCGACHGMDGKGLPTSPPMAPSLINSKLAIGPAEVSAAIVLKGILKQDTKYLGAMAPLGTAMTDDQIADVLTYIRKSWGNTADAVTATEVKSTREKYKDINASLPRSAFEKKAEKLNEEAAAKKLTLSQKHQKRKLRRSLDHLKRSPRRSPPNEASPDLCRSSGDFGKPDRPECHTK